MIPALLIHCGSPTCAATLELPVHPAGGFQSRALARAGWVVQQQPGEEHDRAYCPRCKQ